MRTSSSHTRISGVAALALVLAAAPFPAPAQAPQQPFTMELNCSIPGTTYICTATGTASPTRRFIIESVSFSGQAAIGQTLAANFTFTTGGTKAFVWLPVQSSGPSASAGKGVYVATLELPLDVDSGSVIRLEVSRNSSANTGATTYMQRLNLMGYLQ
jgi:hypothetical protein